MNPSNSTVPVAVGANVSRLVRKFFFAAIIFGLLLALGTARADGPDDDYLAVYTVIDQADTLNASGKTVQAHAKYLEAWNALSQFQRDNANWNPKIVSFRLNYLAEKIDATSGKIVVASSAIPAATVATSPAPTVANLPATADSSAAMAVPISPVKLLDAGSEPRTVLRLHPAAGDKQSVTMTMKIGMDMSAANKSMPAMDIPAMVMSMDVAVKNISADGNITYTLVFNDATIATDANTPPAMATAMKSSLDGISGMTGTGTMSDRGIVKNVEMHLPATAAPQLSQTIGQMKDSLSSSATPLPEEAVGPGAKWEYQTKIKSQGMTIDQTMTFELVSIDGDRVTLRSTITQNAANQIISNPSMPSMKMNLTSMTGNGGGTSVLDLGRLMPASATVAEKVETVMDMNIGQRKQTMDMKMNINVVLESK